MNHAGAGPMVILAPLLEAFVRAVRRDLMLVSVGGAVGPTRAGDLLLCSRSAPLWSGAIVALRGTGRRLVRITGFTGDPCGDGAVGSDQLCVDEPAHEDFTRRFIVARGDVSCVAFGFKREWTIRDLRLRVHWHRPFAARMAEMLWDTWQDRVHGISTRGFVRADTLGLSPARVLAYTPTPWAVADCAFGALAIQDNDVFVDYGCGRGRVLALALRRPFHRVIGIEISPELAEAARRNLRRGGGRVQIFDADASILPLPDDATVVYLFNPFGRDVLPRALARIRESHERRPRHLRIVTYAIDADRCTPVFGVAPQSLARNLLLWDLRDARHR